MKTPITFILAIGLFVTLGLPGCGKKNSKKTELSNHTETQSQKSECQKLYEEYESGRIHLYVENKVTVQIVRKYQRVKRYSCEGQLTSDKIETVHSPRKNIELKPTYKPSKVASVRLFNANSCEYHSTELPLTDLPLVGLLYPVTGNDSGKIKIKADIAPATFTFKVSKGENRIYYTYFEKCQKEVTKTNPDGSTYKECEKQGESRSGIYQLFVDYDSQTLPGVLEIKNCPQDKTTK